MIFIKACNTYINPSHIKSIRIKNPMFETASGYRVVIYTTKTRYECCVDQSTKETIEAIAKLNNYRRKMANQFLDLHKELLEP